MKTSLSGENKSDKHKQKFPFVLHSISLLSVGETFKILDLICDFSFL